MPLHAKTDNAFKEQNHFKWGKYLKVIALMSREGCLTGSTITKEKNNDAKDCIIYCSLTNKQTLCFMAVQEGSLLQASY